MSGFLNTLMAFGNISDLLKAEKLLSLTSDLEGKVVYAREGKVIDDGFGGFFFGDVRREYEGVVEFVKRDSTKVIISVYCEAWNTTITYELLGGHLEKAFTGEYEGSIVINRKDDYLDYSFEIL
jgi:hypothetical protein